MSKGLPFGGITPQSQPLGAYVQPLQRQLAKPTRGALLPQVQGMATLQRAGVSNVAGSNMWSDVASALAPLNKNLTSALHRGLKQNAEDRIDEGYLAEAENQRARAV